jgi:hypothetical protein
VEDVRSRLQQLTDAGKLLNSREMLLMWDPTDTNGVRAVSQQFEPYARYCIVRGPLLFTIHLFRFALVWSTAQLFYERQQLWMLGSFMHIDSVAMESEVLKMMAAMQRAMNGLRHAEAVYASATTVKLEVRRLRSLLSEDRLLKVCVSGRSTKLEAISLWPTHCAHQV